MIEHYQKLLCHFETAVQDDTPNEHTLTAAGSASISETLAKFGDASLKATAAADTVTITDHADFEFGADDFTIDAWYYKDSSDFTAEFIDKQVDANNRFRFFLTSDSLRLTVIDASSSLVSLSAAFSGTLDTWIHVAATRRGDTWNIYKDGVILATAEAAVTVPTLAADVVVSPVAGIGIAYLDELRVLNGMAWWDGAFTPPTAPWIDSKTARQMIRDQDAFLTEFGERIQFLESGQTARTILAIVDRDPPTSIGSGMGSSLSITVANHPAIGITPDQADAGTALVEIATRLGGPVNNRPIKFHRYQDAGFCEYEVL